MNLKIGNLSFLNMNTHYFRYSWDYFLEKQREQLIDSFVFWASVPHIWIDQYASEDFSNKVQMLQALSISIPIIIARPYNYTLFADQNSILAFCSESYYKNIIDFSSSFNVRKVGLCLWGALRDIEHEQQYFNFRRILGKLCGYAEEKGCTISIINTSYTHSALMNSLSEITNIIHDIDSKFLTVGMNYADAIGRGETISQWVDTLGQNLSFIMLSDLKEGKMGYKLGTGSCPIYEDLHYLNAISYSGEIALYNESGHYDQNPSNTDRDNFQWLKKTLES